MIGAPTDSDSPQDKKTCPCLHGLIEEQVSKTPGSVAVEYKGQKLTYLELDQQSNQLAHFLVKRGVGTNTLVGICVDRSFSMLIALLGILKAGGAYVPLDPSYPNQRLAYMLKDSQSLCDKSNY